MFKKISYIFIAFMVLVLLTGCQKSYTSIENFYNQAQLRKNAYPNLKFLLKVKLGNIKSQSLISISKENKRIESSLDNGKNYPTVSIQNETGTYMYIPNSKKAYQTSQNIDSQLDVLDWGNNDFANFSFGKRKKYNGESCLEVVSYKKNSEVYYCISEKYGLPIYSRISIGANYMVETSIHNIKTSKISKKKFQLPKDTKIIRQPM